VTDSMHLDTASTVIRPYGKYDFSTVDLMFFLYLRTCVVGIIKTHSIYVNYKISPMQD